MKREILWLGASWLIVAALVLASCGPTVSGEQEEEEKEEEEEEEVVILSIGETYQRANITVTVSNPIITDSYEYHDRASDSMLTEEASPGTSWLIVTAEINNVGSVPWPAEGPHHFRVVDSEGAKYAYQTYLGENPLKMYTIPVGEKMAGTMLFNIPEGAGGLKIAFGGSPGVRQFGAQVIIRTTVAEWELGQ